MSPLMSNVPGVQKVFRDSMLCTLLDLRPGETDNRGDFLGQAVRADVVRRSRDLVLGAAGEPVTVLDICRACRLSRRAIQSIFLRETGVTPLVYLRAIRLNEVRIQLMTSARDELAIGELAARFRLLSPQSFCRGLPQLIRRAAVRNPTAICGHSPRSTSEWLAVLDLTDLGVGAVPAAPDLLHDLKALATLRG